MEPRKNLVSRAVPRRPVFDAVFGIEPEGFIAASALAHELGAGFVPVRVRGKLPAQVVSIAPHENCAHGALEVHADALVPGQRVLLVGSGCCEGCVGAVARALALAGLDVRHAAEAQQ